MKKLIAVIAGLCLLGGGTLQAQDNAQQQSAQKSPVAVLMGWFERLQQGLSASSVGQNYEDQDSLVAVAAVRGNKQDLANPNQPAWKKSNISKKETLLKERKEFGAAVKEVIAGNIQVGQADLEAFEKAHPHSSLIKDVHQAEKKIAELQKIKSKSDAAPVKGSQSKP